MTILIFFVRVYVLMAAHAMTLCLMSETKERIRYQGRAYLLSYLIFCLAFTALFSVSATARSVNFLYALSLMAYLVFFLAVSSGPWLKNLFLFMAYATYFTLAVGWARYISYFFPSHPDMSMFIIRNVLSLAYIITLLAKVRKYIIECTDGIDSGWLPLAVFSTLSSAIVLGEVLYYYDDIDLVQIGSMTLFLTSAFIVGFSMVMHLRREIDMKEMEARQEIIIKELENEKEALESMRRYHHDIRHHAAVMREYLEDGDIEDAKEYLKQFSASVDRYASPSWCEDRVANAVIRSFARRCRDKGISFTFDGDIPDRLPLSEPETGCVLSNLLDNAIAAAGDGSGFISISSFEKGCSLLLEIRNSIAGDIIWDGSVPHSHRSGGGIGLRNVMSILSCHGGMVRFSTEDGVFITQLVIPL